MGSVNYVGMQGATSSGSPVLVALGLATNIDLNYAGKGTGGHYFGNGAGVGFAVVSDGSGQVVTSNLSVSGASSGNDPTLSSAVNAAYDVPTNYSHLFKVNGVVQGGFNYTHTGSDYLALSAGIGNAYVVGTGSSGTINITFQAKGIAGSLQLLNSQGSAFSVIPNGQTKNGILIRPGNTGTPVTIAAVNVAFDSSGDASPHLQLLGGGGTNTGAGHVQAQVFELLDARYDSGLLRLVPVTGFSQTIVSSGAGAGGLKLVPAGTLAAGTIIMPASPADGQLVRVVSTQTITALTVSANTGQSIFGTPTTITAASPFSMIYDAVATAWMRY